MKKHWVYLKRGLITPVHFEHIGIRLWLYLYLCDDADWGTGRVRGYKDKLAADAFGIPERTVRDWRQGLMDNKYIACKQGQHDLTVTILKWINPREYSGKEYNKTAQGDTQAVPSPSQPAQGDTQGDTAHGDPSLYHSPLKIAGDKRTSPSKSMTPSNQREMVGALCEVMGLDSRLMGARLARLAAALSRLGADPATVRLRYGRGSWYYATDWRGKQGQLPNEAAIRATWGAWAAEPVEHKYSEEF